MVVDAERESSLQYVYRRAVVIAVRSWYAPFKVIQFSYNSPMLLDAILILRCII